MSLPEFFFDRVTADIRQQMEGILALADQLSSGDTQTWTRADLDARQSGLIRPPSSRS